jgi:hypothetical protein
MALELNGTTGVSLVQDGVITDANLPAGSVLQVVSTTKTDTSSVASTTYTDITGLSVSITPSSTNSKILVLTNISINPANSNGALWQLVRNSTPIAVNTIISNASSGGVYTESGANAGNTWNGFGISHLDSPSTTSSVTYKIQVRGGATTTAVFVNRRAFAADYGGVSTITLMEIAG